MRWFPGKIASTGSQCQFDRGRGLTPAPVVCASTDLPSTNRSFDVSPCSDETEGATRPARKRSRKPYPGYSHSRPIGAVVKGPGRRIIEGGLRLATNREIEPSVLWPLRSMRVIRPSGRRAEPASLLLAARSELGVNPRQEPVPRWPRWPPPTGGRPAPPACGGNVTRTQTMVLPGSTCTAFPATPHALRQATPYRALTARQRERNVQRCGFPSARTWPSEGPGARLRSSNARTRCTHGHAGGSRQGPLCLRHWPRTMRGCQSLTWAAGARCARRRGSTG